MRLFAAAIALLVSLPAWPALPGVVELKGAPESIADAELSRLLDARIAAAAVVAIGETVHGSSGMLRVQARLIRYLVERRGFRLIAWENGPLRALELARWLDACTKQKSPPPIDVLYFPTESDLPFFEWMCAFNLAHPADPIVFAGIDVWDRPWLHFARTGRSDLPCPASRATSWTEVDAILAQSQNDRRLVADADYRRCREALSAILASPRRTDAEFDAAISASTLLGWIGFHQYALVDDVESWNARDRAQGTNLDLLMEKHRAARAIVAAHTSHVSHNRSRADWWGFGDLKSGVYFFSERTGKRVFNIALTAYEASGAQGAFSVPTARNSMDRRLREAGHAFAFVPADAPFLAEHARWWIQNQNFPGPFESGVEVVVRDHFDALIFLDKSHLDRALPARPVWEP